MDSLHELKNQVLGCWCTSPNLCHGSILQKLYIEKYGDNEEEEKMKEKKKEQERKNVICPVNGKCLSKNIIYQATIKENISQKEETYIGPTSKISRRD